MFMTMPWIFNTYDLHLGTSWDVATIEGATTRKIMEYIAEGLLNLAGEIEKGRIKRNAKFKGNTFYLKDSTIKKYGFSLRRMNLYELILFAFNYLELCVLNSLLRKKIYFIPLNNIMIVTCSASEILNNKQKYQAALNILRNETVLSKKPAKKKVENFSFGDEGFRIIKTDKVITELESVEA